LQPPTAGREALGQSVKATGTPEEIARYLPVFGGEGRVEREVVV
jgi:hypothetical protein